MTDKPWTASDELEQIPLGTPEEERTRAKNWMDTAAQYARNSDYWRERAENLRRKMLLVLADESCDLSDLNIRSRVEFKTTWTLVPKMKVMCMKEDDPSFGKIGTIVPCGLLATGKVLWAVLIDGVRAWDACEESTIRRDFRPNDE